MWLQSVGLGMVIIFMTVGLVGTFVPLLPGPLLVWMAAALYAIATDFEVISPVAFAVITLIAVAAVTSDVWMSFLGAKTFGASARSVVWGVIGSLLGLFFFSLPGAIAGYAAAVLLAEFRKSTDWRYALRASLGSLAGWGLSTVFQAASALIMIAIFIWEVFGHGR